MKKIPPKLIFPNKPADTMMLGGYVEPLIYGRYLDYGMDVTEDEAYDDLRDSNLNTLIQTESKLNREDNALTENILAQTSKRGLSFMFKDGALIDHRNLAYEFTYESAKKHFESYKKLEKYSSFAGLHFVDEPGYKSWESFLPIKKAFNEIYPDKIFFINLLPTYSPIWAFSNGPCYLPDDKDWIPEDPDFIKYYDSYMDKIKPELFSYDYYPIKGEYPAVYTKYFHMLHLAKKYAEDANIPISAFMQVGKWDTESRVPTEAELRWQVNCAIAYNTKHICYYTYWVPGNGIYDRGMMIDEHGNKTKNYHIIKQINAELLFWDEYFLNAAFEGYMMCGTTPSGEMPQECDRLDCFGALKSVDGGNLFVGCFDYCKDGEVYDMYIVVNNDTQNSASARLSFDCRVDYTNIYRTSKYNGNSDTLTLKLDAGDAAMIIVNKKEN